jgi:hypothetical protein
MNLTLTRTDYLGDGIFGGLTLDDGTPFAVTLEHAYPGENYSFVPKLAAGVYECVRHAPNRLPYETFMVENVPPFQGSSVTGLLLHVGNYNADTIGCILLGRNIVTEGAGGARMITSSQNTFNKFMNLQKGTDKFTLTVKDK